MQLCFIIIVCLFIISCKSRNNIEQSTDLIISVYAEKPKLDSLSIPISCVGRLSSKTEIKLSFKTGGIISNIFVEEGDYVKTGQVLAQLNLKEISAHVNQAKLAFEKSKRDYERIKNLYNDSVATLEQYQNVETAMNYAKTNVEIAEFNLKYSTIQAPANGIILKKVAEANEMIAPGFPVFLFSSKEKDWIIKTNVSDKDIVNIELGDSAEIKFDAYPNIKFKGIVNELAVMSDPYTGTFEVEIKVVNNPHQLITGFIARINIIPSQIDKYFIVPTSALVEGIGNEAYLYKTIGDSSVKKIKTIYKGIINEKLLIKEGLNENDNIVIKGTLFINENSKIVIDNKR